MAQKALENSIRELTKVISGLSDKIDVMDSKLNQQSAEIIKQSEVIEHLRKELEGTKQLLKKGTSSPATTSAPDQPALQQRPMRQARLKALAANGTAAAKGEYAAAAKRSSAVGSCASTANTPEVSRSLPMRSAVAVKEGKLVPPKTIVGPEQCVTMYSATINDQSRNNGGEWKEIRKRNKTRSPRAVLIGTGDGSNGLQAAERTKHLNVWSFRPQTTEHDVLNHINHIVKCDKYKVEKRRIVSEEHASFIISFPESLHESLSSPSSWPPRVKICDWFLARPRRERGEGHNTADGERRSHPARSE